MSGLDWALAAVGLAVTALVVAGMILLTPRGEVELEADDSDNGQGSELSRAGLRRRTHAPS